MVYSIVLIPSENLLQVKSFSCDTECSDYHNYLSSTFSEAVITRARSLESVFQKVKKLSIILKE